MSWLIALTIWVTLAAGVYLSLSRDLFRIVLGLAMLSAAVNLFLFASGRLDSALPAVVPVGEQALGVAANPLPQALVLTAIVIGFAMICFALVLVMRLIGEAGSDNADDLRLAEPEPDQAVKPPLPQAGLAPTWPPEERP